MQIDQAINALKDIANALHDTDRTNVGLVAVTAILAGATIGIGIWNTKKTTSQIQQSEERQERRFQEQSKRHDDEHFERVRPWITIDGPKPKQVIFQDGETLLWDDFRSRDPSDRREPIQMKFVIRYTNTGIRPAKNLGRLDSGVFESFTKEKFEHESEKMMNMDLGPNQDQFITFLISWGNWSILDRNPLFLGLRISYDNGRGRSYSGVIYKVTSNQTESIRTWYE